MAVFVLLPMLVVLCVVLLGPLMLPGALAVAIVVGLVEVARRHHARALRPH